MPRPLCITLQGTWGCGELFETAIWLPLDTDPKVWLLDHMVIPFSFFEKFPNVPSNSAWVFPFPHSITSTLAHLCDHSRSGGREVRAHCGFEVRFPGDQLCRAPFHVPGGHIHVFFGKKKCLFKSLAHFLIRLFGSVLCGVPYWLWDSWANKADPLPLTGFLLCESDL